MGETLLFVTHPEPSEWGGINTEKIILSQLGCHGWVKINNYDVISHYVISNYFTPFDYSLVVVTKWNR